MIYPNPKPPKKSKRVGPKDGRVILSAYQRRKQRKSLWDLRPHVCEICRKTIWTISDMELDHEKPKKMGGGSRDDSDENQRLTHIWCNRIKGSQRNFNVESVGG
jgi:5-methylcytosine-specific restriction endonuclease McrA